MNEQEIFLQVLRQNDEAGRYAILDRVCQGEPQLRQRVEVLLVAHERAGQFLESPAAGPAATIDSPLVERPGTIIGPYKLLQQIGEGGMGVVYMADQEEPVRRRVALKVIKPGMDSRQVIARFEAERQALAMMDHQNIARVLDAGTTESGRPYFVMELVHGVPLTKFCNDNRLTLRQRLDLFVAVCHAIQHAHQKGVIHRDIKPGNILVTMYDDKPVPKVIDFGVAKAVEQRLTEKTLFTQFGMLVGTFEYMSPEQAEMNALGVDTRSDVYSLGVLLYELLTGTTPLDHKRLREAALGEMVRLIKEEEPPRPSVRLSTSTSLPKVAAAFRTEPARLSQLVRGELDWIVMKCLEKDRTRRYETANGLARDVQRFLCDEPVEACPPSLTYRFRKMARKHRGLLTTGTAFLMLLVGGLIFSTWLSVWALNSQRAAQEAKSQAMAALTREQNALKEAVTAKEKAEWTTQRLSTATRLANEGVEFYYRGNRAAALDKFAKATEMEPNLLAIYVHRKMLYTDVGLWDLAAADYAELFRLSPRAHWQTCLEHAVLRYYMGDEAGYRAACREYLRQYGNSEVSDAQMYLIHACSLSPQTVEESAALVRRAENLVAAYDVPWNRSAAAIAHLRAGNYERSVQLCQEVIKSGAKSPDGIHRFNYVTLAIAQHFLGRPDEAKMALANVEGALDEWTRTILDGRIGTMPISWYSWLECLLFYREAKTLITGAPPAEDPRLAAIRRRALNTITYGDAFSLADAGRQHVANHNWDQAAASYDKALSQLPPEVGLGGVATPLCIEMVSQVEVFARLSQLRPKDARIWFARGRIHLAQREWGQAGSDIARTLELDLTGTLGTARLRSATRLELAALRLLAGDEAGYQKLCDEVLSGKTPSDDPFISASASRLCTLRARDNADWSVPVSLAEFSIAKEPRNAWYLYAAAAAQYRAGNYEVAIAHVNESLDSLPTWKGRGQNYLMLALAHQRLGHPAEARDWLAKAKEWLKEMDRSVGQSEFDVTRTPYTTDWLSAQVILHEAEACLKVSEQN